MKANRPCSHLQVSMLLICVIVLLIATSVLTVHHHCDLMQTRVAAVVQASDASDSAAAVTAAEAVDTQWAQSRMWLLLFVPRQSIAEVNTSIAKLLALAESENDELTAECASLRAMLQWLREQH